MQKDVSFLSNRVFIQPKKKKKGRELFTYYPPKATKRGWGLVEFGFEFLFIMNITWLNEIMENTQWTTSKNCKGLLKKETYNYVKRTVFEADVLLRLQDYCPSNN